MYEADTDTERQNDIDGILSVMSGDCAKEKSKKTGSEIMPLPDDVDDIISVLSGDKSILPEKYR